jgi:hypothetical protein
MNCGIKISHINQHVSNLTKKIIHYFNHYIQTSNGWLFIFSCIDEFQLSIYYFYFCIANHCIYIGYLQGGSHLQKSKWL